jgi:two-component system sensor histidine kinase KdpD
MKKEKHPLPMVHPSKKTKTADTVEPAGIPFAKKLSANENIPKYFWSFVIVALITLPGYLLRQTLDTAAIAMFYLLALVGIAVWLGRGPAIAASILGVLALDYFINPPYFSFAINRFESWMTLILMLVESLVISTLAGRLKEQVQWARESEAFTSLLYNLGPTLLEKKDEERFLKTVEGNLRSAFGADVAVFLVDNLGHLKTPPVVAGEKWEDEAAHWSFANGRKTGLSYGSFPNSRKLYLPLGSSARALGVLAVDFHDPHKAFSADQLTRLEGFAGQVASALERHFLFLQAEDNRISAENEKNRSALLSAVSHDLKTPLTAIIGAASGLLEDKGALDPEERSLLTKSIYSEAERLKHLVQNLLDMTRLEAGALEPKKEWQSMEELVGVALDRLKPRLTQTPLTLDFQAKLPLAFIDGLLVEQLILNLLQNALNHTPRGTPVQLSVKSLDDGLQLEVADQGPGLKPGEEKSIFEKFIRGYHSGGKGAGLGLSICLGIARAHGGNITASNRPGGGASFILTLPTGGPPPTVQEE